MSQVLFYTVSFCAANSFLEKVRSRKQKNNLNQKVLTIVVHMMTDQAFTYNNEIN